jgi:signal transduction histidine kinase
VNARQTAPSAAETTFPVVVALEAFDAWLREPTPERQAWLGEALAGVVRAAGAVGAYLEVDAPPLPALAIGFGTLSARPIDDGGSIVQHRLAADRGRVEVGRLWLDAEGPDGDLAARAVGLALDAAWSRATVRQTAERLEALDAAVQGIAGVLEVARVLQLIVDRVRDLVGARYAALGILDDTGAIERFLTSGIAAADRARIGTLPRGHGVLGLIVREARAIRIADIGTHPAAHGFPAHHPPMRSFLGVPVTVKGRAIGNLYLTDKLGADEFSAEDQQLAETFALHAGIAIDNARLHDQVQRLAIVEERERIGKDLHDGIIQGVYAIALSLEDVPELMRDDPAEATSRVDRAIDGLNLTIRDIRNFILGLHSELIAGGDLVAGLATLALEFRLNSTVDIDIDLESGEEAAQVIPLEQRVQLLQMAREALSNAARHSRATRASISLHADDEWLNLEVIDNGVGFDPRAPRNARHLGLVNLRGRAAAMGGTLLIESEPGAGTRIIVRLPLAQRPSDGPAEGPVSVPPAGAG